jgi:7-keto-8-aminopelargonate synthetase-like enzyme
MLQRRKTNLISHLQAKIDAYPRNSILTNTAIMTGSTYKMTGTIIKIKALLRY